MDFLQHEQQAELDALIVLAFASTDDCLAAHGLALSIEVTNAKGETITIRGRDFFDRKLWKAFTKKSKQNAEIYQLTGNVELLAIQFTKWISTEYTPRYRAITSEADLAWVEQVAVLVVKRRILEQKYDAYLKQQRATFADPSIIAPMAVITAYHQMIKESARVAHHIIKDVALAKELLKQFSEIFRHLVPEIQVHNGQTLALPPISLSHQEETQQEERAQDE